MFSLKLPTGIEPAKSAHCGTVSVIVGSLSETDEDSSECRLRTALAARRWSWQVPLNSPAIQTKTRQVSLGSMWNSEGSGEIYIVTWEVRQMTKRLCLVAISAIPIFFLAYIWTYLMTRYYLPRSLIYSAWAIAAGWMFGTGRRILRRA